MAAELAALSDRVTDMNDNPVWDGMSGIADQLNHEVGALKMGMIVFDQAVHDAKQFAKGHGQPIETTTAAIESSIETLQGKVTKKGDPPSRSRTRIDDRPEAAIWKEAIDVNLGAAHEAALSVRMGMATGSEPVLFGDVQRLARHLNLVSDLLGQAPDKKASQPYKPRVRGLLGEVRQLQHENTRAGLTVMFQNTKLADVVSALEHKVGH
jgi:hypothetical protein